MRTPDPSAGGQAAQTKFSPGPWSVFEHSDHSGLCIGPPYSESWMKGDDDPGFRTLDVANMRGGLSGVTEQQRANARLIAAAPELYEALNVARSTLSRLNGDVSYEVWQALYEPLQQIDAALAKAEGRP